MKRLSNKSKAIIGIAFAGIVVMTFVILISTHIICLNHKWEEATCTTPKLCCYCGKTEGEAKGHMWKEATCAEPTTCYICEETEGEPLGHVWVEATCTTPKHCGKCSKTEGAVLAHKWAEATCTMPKTCSDCYKVEGEARGHLVQEWEITRNPTCTMNGERSGVCIRCKEVVAEAIEKAEHTAGEWVVTTEATAKSKGYKSQKCTVCSTILKTESYELTLQEIKQQYIDKCQSYSYAKIARQPSAYDGKYARFNGKVIQVMQDTLYGIIIYTLRVNVSDYGYYSGNTMYVTYYALEDAPRILEDDVINMYGTLTGEKTYETIWGNSVTIPSFSAEYIDIQ